MALLYQRVLAKVVIIMPTVITLNAHSLANISR